MSSNEPTTENLSRIETLVQQKTGQPLSNLQRLVLEECLQSYRKTYEAIAAENNYSNKYIQQRVAPELWYLLSEIVGKKVTKSNCKTVLFGYLESLHPAQPTASNHAAQANQSHAHKQSSDTDTQHTPQDVLLEFPTESVPLGSPYYIQRQPYETQCYQLISQVGALIRIKGPRQVGKTSLMTRIVSRAKDYPAVVLNFQQTEQTILTDLDKLLRWICANITRQLKLPQAIEDFWDEDIGSKMSCTVYLEEYILTEITTPIVLVLEESSQLFEHGEIAKDFFSMLRAWHEYTKHNEEWQKLRLILVQSTETYIQLNTNQSPFNVGFEVALTPFNEEQVVTLIKRSGLSFDLKQLAQIMALLAGHPYLVRLALYYLASKKVSWDDLLYTAGTDAGIFKHHLQRHLRQLQQYDQLSNAFRVVLEHEGPVKIGQEEAFKLQSMGLVMLVGNQVQVSCKLYQQYFQEHLVLNTTDLALSAGYRRQDNQETG
ncbi:MAG: AAA-like domain-containing protein [Cyanobacteria bacterium J06649_4]